MANLYFRQFVTLDQVKARLRIDNDDEDGDITDLIQGCTAVITAYLKVPDIYEDSTGEIPEDSNGDPLGIPKEVQLATLLLIGYMYRDRDGNDMAQWQQGYLPWQVTAVIYHLRDPALA
jgi:Phage gp6-like head-tail connector protein